jgi:hypothetical protein
VTDELVAWLREQVAEDERVARVASVHGDTWVVGSPSGVWPEDDREGYGMPIVYDEGRPLFEQAVHIARHDPARVLAEVAAKRRIIDALDIAERNTAHVRRTAPEYRWVQVAEAARDAMLHAARLLASVYAGRPGWRSEWAPDEEETT